MSCFYATRRTVRYVDSILSTGSVLISDGKMGSDVEIGSVGALCTPKTAVSMLSTGEISLVEIYIGEHVGETLEGIKHTTRTPNIRNPHAGISNSREPVTCSKACRNCVAVGRCSGAK